MYYIQENDKPNITTKIFKKIEIDSNKILLPKIEENKKTFKKNKENIKVEKSMQNIEKREEKITNKLIKL